MNALNGVSRFTLEDVRKAVEKVELLARNTKSDAEISDSLKASVSLQCWGHGESGYVVTVFGSYNEAEAKRAAELIQWLIEAAREALPEGGAAVPVTA